MWDAQERADAFQLCFAISATPNAAAQPRLEARAQRTLEGVGCSRLFGWAGALGALPAPPLRRDPFEQA